MALKPVLPGGLVSVPASGSVPVSLVANGRLTTESGVAVSTSDRASQGTIYFTPYGGNNIALYSGAAWSNFAFAEVSLALSGLTSGKNYDVFVYNNSGTLTLELSAAWSGDNTPTDAIVLQNGVSVKSGATTRRWVGTIRTTGTTTTEDSVSHRFVWSAYNQVPAQLSRREIATAHAYGTATFREWNNGTGGPHRVNFVSGASQTFQASGWAETNTGGSGICITTLSLDPTTEGAASITNSSAAATRMGMAGIYKSLAGFNEVTVTEYASASNTFSYYQLSATILK